MFVDTLNNSRTFFRENGEWNRLTELTGKHRVGCRRQSVFDRECPIALIPYAKSVRETLLRITIVLQRCDSKIQLRRRARRFKIRKAKLVPSSKQRREAARNTIIVLSIQRS